MILEHGDKYVGLPTGLNPFLMITALPILAQTIRLFNGITPGESEVRIDALLNAEGVFLEHRGLRGPRHAPRNQRAPPRSGKNIDGSKTPVRELSFHPA